MVQAGVSDCSVLFYEHRHMCLQIRCCVVEKCAVVRWGYQKVSKENSVQWPTYWMIGILGELSHNTVPKQCKLILRPKHQEKQDNVNLNSNSNKTPLSTETKESNQQLHYCYLMVRKNKSKSRWNRTNNNSIKIWIPNLQVLILT